MKTIMTPAKTTSKAQVKLPPNPFIFETGGTSPVHALDEVAARLEGEAARQRGDYALEALLALVRLRVAERAEGAPGAEAVAA